MIAVSATYGGTGSGNGNVITGAGNTLTFATGNASTSRANSNFTFMTVSQSTIDVTLLLKHYWAGKVLLPPFF